MNNQEKIRMVLAGNRREFEYYLAENGLTDSQARYVFDEQSARGYGHDYEIVQYGTYYTHPKYHELFTFLTLNKSND